MNERSFRPKRIVKSATIELSERIDIVLPLFGAREEQKWEPDWKPEFLYPVDQPDEKDNVFKTEHSVEHGHGAIVSHWVMTEFSRELGKVSYAIFSGHDITTISILCEATTDSTTSAEVEYVMTSLDSHGDMLIEHKAERIFFRNLDDWEEAINQYLKQRNE